jgi:hypothetical protein
VPILAYYCAQFIEIRSELKDLVNFALQVYYEEAKREKKFLSILGEHERYSPLSLPYERYRIDRSRILTKITELIGRNLGRIDRNVTDLLIRSGTWRREQRLLPDQLTPNAYQHPKEYAPQGLIKPCSTILTSKIVL